MITAENNMLKKRVLAGYLFMFSIVPFGIAVVLLAYWGRADLWYLAIPAGLPYVIPVCYFGFVKKEFPFLVTILLLKGRGAVIGGVLLLAFFAAAVFVAKQFLQQSQYVDQILQSMQAQ